MSHFGCALAFGCAAVCSGAATAGAVVTLRTFLAAGFTVATWAGRRCGGCAAVTAGAVSSALATCCTGGGKRAASFAACTDASVSGIGGNGAAIQSRPNTALLAETSPTAQ